MEFDLAAPLRRDLPVAAKRGSGPYALEAPSVAWLTARYLIESEPELIEKRANALALEQSVECPLEAIGSQFVLDEIVARVDQIKELGERRYLVDVKIATATTGGEPAQLLNMIFGNCSLWENVQIVDVD